MKGARLFISTQTFRLEQLIVAAEGSLESAGHSYPQVSG